MVRAHLATLELSMFVRAILPCTTLALIVAGCAASSDSETGGATDDVTASSYYDCFSSSSDGVLAHFELALRGDALDVTDLSKDAAPPDTGKLDPSYRPSSTYASYVRYSGYAKIGGQFSETQSVDMLASKELQTRAAKGTLAIRTAGSDGGGTSRATCTAKAKPLTVDPARKARLSCSLSQSICVDDNPPGSTCLFDLFVNQTSAGAATLKRTYLDHFGVRVVERPVSLGASKALRRTGQEVEVSWADATSLKLDLRGGITYTGTYADPSGQSRDVQCNDLAMLDP